MQRFIFEGIGTHWDVKLEDDGGFGVGELEGEIQSLVDEFDRKYSRFRDDSLVAKILKQGKMSGRVEIGLAGMLDLGQRLKELTEGKFDPAVGLVMEQLGYDTEYSFRKKSEITKPEQWKITNGWLETMGPVLFDVGAWGKGVLIDLVADLLIGKGIEKYLINGGGDVRGGVASDMEAWLVVLEHPRDPKQAIGTVKLGNGAVAGSSGSRRKWVTGHHIVDGRNGEAVDEVLGVYTWAETGGVADGAATALFIVGPEKARVIAREMGVEYVMVLADESYVMSSNMPVEMFVKVDNRGKR